MKSIQTFGDALLRNFLGNSPYWYKAAILGFLVLNPLLMITYGPVTTGWLLIFEFIFTLAMALKCYPLQPGGLLAIEAVIIGLTHPEQIYHEVAANLPVILLLMFMVAGIYFMKGMLLFVFTKLLLNVRDKIQISLLFSFMGAFLSAFLDALTVTAVLISACVGFYAVYHKVASGAHAEEGHDHSNDDRVAQDRREELEQFRAFLRSLLMHGAVGTALGGVCTLVGEPQNLLIGEKMGWHFIEFFLNVAPVSLPVLVMGLLTVVVLEKKRWFGYGALIPETVFNILRDFDREQDAKRTERDRLALYIQFAAALFLIVALAMHLAEVGLIGLTVIILVTSFNGVVEEHQIGHAFEEAMPFTALLVVFFTIVSVIHDQHLFTPIIDWVLAMEPSAQPAMFFAANGLLSAISDNVFVATVYINEVAAAFDAGNISRQHFDTLAIAINTGTNLPSVATPNGQAAFLFLLTSAIAPLVRLSYMRMVVMALPYTLVLSLVGLGATVLML
ncbi:sodium/proton antiporter NhaB [Motiliproteus coralliicola]|uniref:Na(+)/H(+) antiporter NhaB n=1 Tax=Motiliproteus coralliicola TaxID=2283196 RepID=A0A369WS74_9GAMM|nr:sodium/proton antiporter NhaB [Motiliproteus coralliicola]RDE24958.1 sodium/proton antiporter NhaB [Motiliproteus coralliicola]